MNMLEETRLDHAYCHNCLQQVTICLCPLEEDL